MAQGIIANIAPTIWQAKYTNTNLIASFIFRYSGCKDKLLF
jgi:hypothetical protein